MFRCWTKCRNWRQHGLLCLTTNLPSCREFYCRKNLKEGRQFRDWTENAVRRDVYRKWKTYQVQSFWSIVTPLYLRFLKCFICFSLDLHVCCIIMIITILFYFVLSWLHFFFIDSWIIPSVIPILLRLKKLV